MVARTRDGDNAAPFTITEISGQLKRMVEDRFGHVRLRGELSGVKRAASGHLYCALKDDKAVIDGVMWRGNAGRLGFAAEDGQEVIATGKLTTYSGRSKYQIVIETMEIAGEGALLALLEKTRARLAAEGLFDEVRKRPLPYLPRTIGVVTSPTGAVIRDILHRLRDRFPVHVLVWPVLVQGQGSADQVAAAIRGFADLPEGIVSPDLLIVARGGGSVEDLWGFNEEAVVRAIGQSPIPVISAVGHETDTSLADHAADRRAPTPTAAAEMAVPVRAELAATVDDLAFRARRAIARPVSLGRERLSARVDRLPRSDTLLQQPAQRLDDATDRLRRGLRDRAAQGRERLSALRLTPAMLERPLREAGAKLAGGRLVPALLETRLDRVSQRFAALERLHISLDPRAPLERGYALVRDDTGALLRRKTEAAAHDRLAIEFADGVLKIGTERPRKPKKARVAGASARQDDLFG